MTVTSSGEAFKRRLSSVVRVSKRVDLAFQVGGPIIQIPVDEGQKVRKGYLLAHIDPTDFQVNLKNAEGRLARAQAALQLPQTEYERTLRMQKLRSGGRR